MYFIILIFDAKFGDGKKLIEKTILIFVIQWRSFSFTYMMHCLDRVGS